MKTKIAKRSRRLKEPSVLKLIRRRRVLENLVRAIPDGDAPLFSRAFERHETLAQPFRNEIAALTRRIGKRPSFWKPRPKTKEDFAIEKQYAQPVNDSDALENAA